MQINNNESVFFNFDKINNDFEYKTIKSSMPQNFEFEPFFEHFKKALFQNIADDDHKAFIKTLIYWHMLVDDCYEDCLIRKFSDYKTMILEQIRSKLTDAFTFTVSKKDVDLYTFLENKLKENPDILEFLIFRSRESDLKNCPDLLFFLYRLSDKTKSSELLKILYFGTFKFGKASAIIGADFPNASDISKIDKYCSSFNNRYPHLFKH